MGTVLIAGMHGFIGGEVALAAAARRGRIVGAGRSPVTVEACDAYEVPVCPTGDVGDVVQHTIAQAVASATKAKNVGFLGNSRPNNPDRWQADAPHLREIMALPNQEPVLAIEMVRRWHDEHQSGERT